MIVYFMMLGALAIGFIIGMLYAENKNRK